MDLDEGLQRLLSSFFNVSFQVIWFNRARQRRFRAGMHPVSSNWIPSQQELRSTANFLIVMMPGTRTPVLPVSEGAAAAATYSSAAYKAHACAHSTCRVSPQPALTKPAS